MAAGEKRVLIVLPTGSGKTYLAVQLPKRWINKRVLIVVPNQEIHKQFCETLDRERVGYETLRAGEFPDLRRVRVLVAMAQTLSRRIATDLFALWRPDLVLLDEFHRLFDSHVDLLDWFTGIQVFALTATPIRLDNQSLFDVCPAAILGPSIVVLQQMGFLIPSVTFTICRPDLKQIKIINNDFATNQIEKVFLAERVLAIVVEQWRRLAAGKRTVVFATSVAVSRAMVAVFKKAGIKAKHCDANTPNDERAQSINDLRAGRISILSNVGLFTEGVDIVEVEAIIVLFATMSLSKFLQSVGRGTRLSPRTAKKRILILDAGGNSYRFGTVEAERDWMNDGKVRAKAYTLCRCCGALWWGGAQITCKFCNTPARALALAPPLAAESLKQARALPLALLHRGTEWRRAEAVRAAAGAPFSTVDLKFLPLKKRAG